MLDLIRTTETKQPVYAVTVSNRCSHLRPVLAASESECIEVFAMEIIRCISEYENNTTFFFDAFPELKELYPGEDNIPTIAEIYAFLKNKNLINAAMTEINNSRSTVNESNYFFTGADGTRAGYKSAINIADMDEFRAINHNGCQYHVRRWDSTKVAVAVDKKEV